jgi:hypothetical protein
MGVLTGMLVIEPINNLILLLLRDALSRKPRFTGEKYPFPRGVNSVNAEGLIVARIPVDKSGKEVLSHDESYGKGS